MKENLKTGIDGELLGGPRYGEYGSVLNTELTPQQRKKTATRGKALLAHSSEITESSFLDPEVLMWHLETVAGEIQAGTQIDQCRVAQMILEHAEKYLPAWTELLKKGATDVDNPEHLRYRTALDNLQFITR